MGGVFVQDCVEMGTRPDLGDRAQLVLVNDYVFVSSLFVGRPKNGLKISCRFLVLSKMYNQSRPELSL